MKKKIEVSFVVTCTVEVDQDVIDEALTEDWQADFYTMVSEQDVANHLAYNMLRGSSLSSLDGFAQFHDDKAKLTEESWSCDFE